MIDDCAKPLIPNLKSFCCLRHLIEMSKVCEERMISHKYYKYILRFFHKYSQISPKSNVSSTNSLPLTLALLSIMSKCISYFYSVSKISFSKRQLIMFLMLQPRIMLKTLTNQTAIMNLVFLDIEKQLLHLLILYGINQVLKSFIIVILKIQMEFIIMVKLFLCLVLILVSISG